MRSQIKQLSNFSRSLTAEARCFRPDDEWDIPSLFAEMDDQEWLARGNGLSYNDSCLFEKGQIIDTLRLNHLLEFDASSGLVVCQAATTFADLLLLDEDYIPAVIPGTLHATVAGGVAHDVHGKNNPHMGSFGHHVQWIELQVGTKKIHCDSQKHTELFKATIGGLGLTGVIRRVGLILHKASRCIAKSSKTYEDLGALIEDMKTEGLQHNYQVAWLDMLNEPRAILFYGDHAPGTKVKALQQRALPKFSLPLINRWLMKQFNKAYYQQAKNKVETVPLWQFNNPLDALKNWNYLYGKKGLLQFQGVFPSNEAPPILQKLIGIIQTQQATPTLAILKLFAQEGAGFLSFPKPGFTLAVDFLNNESAHKAIQEMNALIAELKGNIYLAKDQFLTEQQFKLMNPKHTQFTSVLSQHNSPMRSDLSKRLGIHHA